MMTKFDDLTVYESPDGGKTVYSRKMGETVRTLHRIDPMHQKELNLSARASKMKQAVYLEDPAIDELIHKIEMLMELKR